MQYTAGDATTYPVTGSHLIAVPALGTLRIRVYRVSGAVSCNSYTLTVSN